MTAYPVLRMNNGVEIPQVGFGLWQVPLEDSAAIVTTALEAGYRHIDTARVYGNEVGVGKAIADSAIPRNEIFVTTKLWNSDQGADRVMAAFDESLRDLKLDVVDLFLIHWPQPMFDQYLETWKLMEKIAGEGRARAIGVSNFTREHLERLLDETDTVPTVNQIELHPWLPQEELREFHAAHGILTEAWSPIGQGKGLLADGKLVELAEAKQKSPAQVVLRWHIQLGNVVFPKSVHPERVRENIALFDFELSDDEMATINSLKNDKRLGPDPMTFAVR